MTDAEDRLAAQPAARSAYPIVLRLLRNWRFRRRLTKLTNLNNRLLQDIGLRRDDLDWALNRPLTVNESHKLIRIVRRCTD
jgi:uncharacterized protein YjiS (DUF1127 family)